MDTSEIGRQVSVLEELARDLEKLRMEKLKAEAAVKEISKNVTAAEAKLREYMEDSGIEETKIKGFGSVALGKVVLNANVKVEDREALYDYLRSIKREDLIRESVHAKTLSTFVTERVENGEKVPDFVNVYPTRRVNIRMKR